MALTPEEVRKIASLARLRFTPEEEGRFVDQLGKIVDYIDQLQSYETGEGDAAPTAPVRESEDRQRPCLPRELFLANAPASALGEFLVVPEVKGGGEDA
ncbi:MAG TPA: Asp-tRNA(Asn)/Glu-tRNA(Gln) amidotransferase subunit GatC [Thermoanaerobaculia bacterium]